MKKKWLLMPFDKWTFDKSHFREKKKETVEFDRGIEKSLTRAKFDVREEYLDWWSVAEGTKPPIPVLLWFTDGQKIIKENKKNLCKCLWLNQHSLALRESEAAAV